MRKDSSSDILNMSDFPPIHEEGVKPIIWARGQKNQLHSEGMACFLIRIIVIWYYTIAENKENEAPSRSSDVEILSTPPRVLAPFPLKSPLRIKRKASTSADEHQNKRQRTKIVVSTAYNPV